MVAVITSSSVKPRIELWLILSHIESERLFTVIAAAVPRYEKCHGGKTREILSFFVFDF